MPSPSMSPGRGVGVAAAAVALAGAKVGVSSPAPVGLRVAVSGGSGVAVGGAAVGVRVAVALAAGVDVREGVVLAVRVRVAVGNGGRQPQESMQLVCADWAHCGSQPLVQQNESAWQTQVSQVELPQPAPTCPLQQGSPPGVGVGVGPPHGHCEAHSELARSTQNSSHPASGSQQRGSASQTQFWHAAAMHP